MASKHAAQSFRDLHVWQRSIELAAVIYRLTRVFPREELYGLTSQIRRAAVSISSNIAEGQRRLAVKEFPHFLGIARGSNFELQSQLEIARELRFGYPSNNDDPEAVSHEVGKMLCALLIWLKSPHELADNRQLTTDDSSELF